MRQRAEALSVNCQVVTDETVDRWRPGGRGRKANDPAMGGAKETYSRKAGMLASQGAI